MLCATALVLAAAGASGRSASAVPNVYVVRVAGPQNVIVAGSGGVFATSDAGARWHDITPRTMRPVLFGHIVDIESFGTERVWLAPVGDQRLDYVPYTDNGGAKWHVGVLPGGAALSGTAPILSFWTPENGRVVGERNGGAIGVYQTHDGGASWRQVAGATPGPLDGPATFTSASAGWAWTREGLLYRTENGGRIWQRVRLPALGGYELTDAEQPEFFGRDVVVVIARLRGGGGATRTAFYKTTDGGGSWRPRLTPRSPATTTLAFAASATDWFVLAGAQLFATTDAGRVWQTVRVRRPTGLSINAIDYLGPTIGWAEAVGPAIGDLHPTYLLRTTNGGRNWSKVEFP